MPCLKTQKKTALMPALTRRQLVNLVLITFMWGMNWPIMKVTLTELSPLHFRAATMMTGALCLGLYFHFRGVRVMPRGRREWRDIVVLAVPNIIGCHGMSVYGVALLPAGRASVLVYTMPIWTVLLSVLFYGERFTRRLLLAVAAVSAGITLQLWEELTSLSGHPAGVLWMQGAALSWALGTVWMRHSKVTLPPQSLVVWMIAVASVVMWVLAWVFEPPQQWQFSTPVWLTLVWAVLSNYGVSQVLWFGLARVLPPSTSAMSVVAVLLISILSSPIIIGEWPTWQDLAALLCVVVAIAAVVLRRD
jgi:drug/metabolite transporter (DMT)-like permease